MTANEVVAKYEYARVLFHKADILGHAARIARRENEPELEDACRVLARVLQASATTAWSEGFTLAKELESETAVDDGEG